MSFSLVDGLASLTQLTVFAQSLSLTHKHMFVFLFLFEDLLLGRTGQAVFGTDTRSSHSFAEVLLTVSFTQLCRGRRVLRSSYYVLSYAEL